MGMIFRKYYCVMFPVVVGGGGGACPSTFLKILLGLQLFHG